jgi:VanZ family protein
MPHQADPRPRRRSLARLSWRRGVSWSSKNRWLALSVAAVIAAVVLSVLPGRWMSLTRRGLPAAVGDAIELWSHFLGYAVLVGLASMACDSFAKLMLVLAAAIVLSGGLELVQLLVPHRGASLADLSMNILGASAGYLIGAARLRRRRRTLARGQGG